MIPAEEAVRCGVVAERHAIDVRLLIALRQTENGAPGREFGVLSVPAATWDEQAAVAARTIRHTVSRFARNVSSFGWWDDERGRYTEDFVLYFSRGGKGWEGYAPLRAANDPTGLNANHYPNLSRFYAALCA